MSLVAFLILQITAHILADYFLQTDALANDKNEKGFKSKFLVWHVLIVFLVSWLLSFQVKFFIGAAAIAIIHYLVDGFKPRLSKHKYLGRYAFFIDQLIHISIVVLVVFLFENYHGVEVYYALPFSEKTIFIFAAYLLCLKPANILIKETFRSSQLQIAGINELPNAGKLIGSLERVLTFTFIVSGQFEAVGFLIAAKSILRYRDDETLKTEYVLIGTMLSFGIAVVLGIIAGTF